jgi:hypothetical protein
MKKWLTLGWTKLILNKNNKQNKKMLKIISLGNIRHELKEK